MSPVLRPPLCQIRAPPCDPSPIHRLLAGVPVSGKTVPHRHPRDGWPQHRAAHGAPQPTGPEPTQPRDGEAECSVLHGRFGGTFGLRGGFEGTLKYSAPFTGLYGWCSP